MKRRCQTFNYRADTVFEEDDQRAILNFLDENHLMPINIYAAICISNAMSVCGGDTKTTHKIVIFWNDHSEDRESSETEDQQ